MRISLFLVALMISVGGFSQTDWNTFPKSEAKSQDTLIGEGILTDTMYVVKTANHQNEEPGNLNITVSPEIILLDEQLKDKAKANSKIRGFTILIFSGSGANSKNNARNRQNEFTGLFPSYISHLTWKSPNYEVRVGDFRTKLEAEKVLQEIKKDYPSAIVRADLIELPKLNEPK